MQQFVLLFLFLISSISYGYIPPVRNILEKVSDNAGNGIYSLEQEVQINTGLDPLFLKETWVVENERTFRLTVTGVKELKDSVHLQFIYIGGQKWQLKDGKKEASKIPDEFIERFFHARNHDNLIAYLQNQKILPSPLGQRKFTGKDGKYESEPYLRLARTDGVINYALGTPTPTDQSNLNPGLWVEQDQFVIRKIRFPSQAEIIAENYAAFTRGLNFPKLRTVQWGSNSVHLRVLSVSTKAAADSFQTSSLESPRVIKNISNPAVQSLIEEFYSRFR